GRDRLNGSQIPPSATCGREIVVEIFFAPAICWARGKSGSGLRGGDAIEGIVSERLRARGNTIVGDADDVAVVTRAEAEVVGEIENIADVGGVGAGSGRSAGTFCRDAAGLEARVVIERADESAAVGE